MASVKDNSESIDDIDADIEALKRRNIRLEAFFLFLFGLFLPIWCLSTLANYYLKVSFQLTIIFNHPKSKSKYCDVAPLKFLTGIDILIAEPRLRKMILSVILPQGAHGVSSETRLLIVYISSRCSFSEQSLYGV